MQPIHKVVTGDLSSFHSLIGRIERRGAPWDTQLKCYEDGTTVMTAMTAESSPRTEIRLRLPRNNHSSD